MTHGRPLMTDPGAHYRTTCQRWNEAASSLPGWPPLTVDVPNRRKDYVLDRATFPSSFEAGLERYLTMKEEPDIFSDDYRAPKSPITIRNERRQLWALASAMVHAGVPAESLTGLAALVEVENAMAGLQWLHRRFDNKIRPETARLATLLKTVAKHYVRVKPEALAQLTRIAQNLGTGRPGFTEKNRTFLQQFSDQRVLHRLLTLPFTLVEDVLHSDTGLRGSAVVVEFAVATAILTVLPLRVKNLCGLEVDRHLRWHGDHLIVSIPAEATKNKQPIEAELPPEVADLIAVFLETFRPRLTGPGCPWLFPGENGAKRQSGGFGTPPALYRPLPPPTSRARWSCGHQCTVDQRRRHAHGLRQSGQANQQGDGQKRQTRITPPVQILRGNHSRH